MSKEKQSELSVTLANQIAKSIVDAQANGATDADVALAMAAVLVKLTCNSASMDKLADYVKSNLPH